MFGDHNRLEIIRSEGTFSAMKTDLGEINLKLKLLADRHPGRLSQNRGSLLEFEPAFKLKQAASVHEITG